MKTEEQVREKMRDTPAGRLLVRYGFEPYDTESSARIVADKAAEEIGTLQKELTNFRTLVSSLATLEDLQKAKLAVGYGMSAGRFLSNAGALNPR